MSVPFLPGGGWWWWWHTPFDEGGGGGHHLMWGEGGGTPFDVSFCPPARHPLTPFCRSPLLPLSSLPGSRLAESAAVLSPGYTLGTMRCPLRLRAVTCDSSGRAEQTELARLLTLNKGALKAQEPRGDGRAESYTPGDEANPEALC